MLGYNVENEVQILLSLRAVLSPTPQEGYHKAHPDLDVPVLPPLHQTQLCGVPVPTPSVTPECCGLFLSPTCSSSVCLVVIGLLMPPQRSRWSLFLSHFSHCCVLLLTCILINPTLSPKIWLLLSVQPCCCSGHHFVVSLFLPYVPHHIPNIVMDFALSDHLSWCLYPRSPVAASCFMPGSCWACPAPL